MVKMESSQAKFPELVKSLAEYARSWGISACDLISFLSVW